jgi:hypothetical protein
MSPQSGQSNKEGADSRRDSTSGPLDGSTSGTIGGGGPETGGPTDRPHPADAPPPDPGDAASGRLASDPLAGTNPPDPTRTGPTDTSRR